MIVEAIERSEQRLTCFGTYDVRGVVGNDLTPDIARRIGAAVAEVLRPDVIVIGRDSRLSGETMAGAFADGAMDQACDVIDLGMASTEEVYFACTHFGTGAGVAITASHNPAEYNGMKIVGPESRPLTTSEFMEIARLSATAMPSNRRGRYRVGACRQAHAAFLADQLAPERLWPTRMAVNAGHGVAGFLFDAVVRELERRRAVHWVHRIQHDPDGGFPCGVPNPLLQASRGATSRAVVSSGADIGIAWDGDGDRCFVFDHEGCFVDGAYFAAMLARLELTRAPGATVLHDERVVWPMERAARAGGVAQVVSTGHVHMKRAMAVSGAVYGGEMSGHHYFREFHGCDSGMLPWLKALEAMSAERASLRELIAPHANGHEVSGERNYRVASRSASIARVRRAFSEQATDVRTFDGLSMIFDNWRFNLRASSTEPHLRLNVECRGDAVLLEEKAAKLEAFLSEEAGCIPA